MTDPAPGLYVHVPFCSAKCPYCDFYSLAAPGLRAAWLEGIRREITLHDARPVPFDTLYLGGGTPSQLEDDQITALMQALSIFPRTPEAEVTIEVNPEDVTRERAAFFLGIRSESYFPGGPVPGRRRLAFLGRRHTAGQAMKAAVAIREAGCDNLCLDLMYGLPGQKSDSWLATLDRALALRPEHLSCYLLSTENGTVFGRRAEQGEIMTAGEDVGEWAILATSCFLEERGYVHYEVSSFSLGPDRYSRHNRKYWGAHSLSGPGAGGPFL